MVESNKQDDILSKRELEILRLIAKGYTDKSISGILNISPFTVKTHRRAILEKFQAKNCTEAVHKATKIGMKNTPFGRLILVRICSNFNIKFKTDTD